VSAQPRARRRWHDKLRPWRRRRWVVEGERVAEPSAERDAESAFAFDLRRPTGEHVETRVEYETGAKHGSLEAAREILKPYVKRRQPPPLVLVDSSGISRADYGGPEWPADERARLVEHRLKASESYDKMIVTLAGGGLGLTIAFIHDLAPHPRQVWLLAVGWTLWCASLLLVLLSYLSSMAAHAQIIDQMDEQVPSVRRPRQWTTWFNYSAALLLVAGAGFVVGFSCYNLLHAERQKPGKARTGIRRGADAAEARGDRRSGQARDEGPRAFGAAKAAGPSADQPEEQQVDPPCSTTPSDSRRPKSRRVHDGQASSSAVANL
jgi:hypothetical protein